MQERIFWFTMIVLLIGSIAYYSSISRADEPQNEREYTAGCP